MSVEEFYAKLAEGKVLALRCEACGKLSLPPKLSCPSCGSKSLSRAELPGEGRVVSYSIVHVAPVKFAEIAPYAVALVELEGGLVVPGMVRGDPSRVVVGLKVKLSPELPPQSGWPRWPRLVFVPE